MKYFISLLLIGTFLLGLVACAPSPETSLSKPTPSTTQTQLPTSTVSTYPSTASTHPTFPTTLPTQPTTLANLAPDFTVYNTDQVAVSLSDFIGKPVVLNFWASWCNPCKSEMPAFQAIYETYGQDVQFLMVNLTDGTYETQLSATTFIQQQGYTFPIFFDSYYSAVGAYNISSIPATFFIDAEGCLVAQASGRINAFQLQTYIQKILP